MDTWQHKSVVVFVSFRVDSFMLNRSYLVPERESVAVASGYVVNGSGISGIPSSDSYSLD